MLPQLMSMCFTERAGTMPVATPAWEIHPKGRWAWLQKVCWWFLKQTRAAHPFIDVQPVLRVVHFDPDLLVFRLILEAREQISAAGYRTPKKVYLGREDFFRLTQEKDTHFGGFADFTIKSAKTHGRVLDLDITVVPYMKGILIV